MMPQVDSSIRHCLARSCQVSSIVWDGIQITKELGSELPGQALR